MFGQLPNTKEYLKRVKDAGGTVRNDVQLAINDFTKSIYRNGFRSTVGSNHKISHCSIYPTETKTGSNQNLWYLSSQTSHLSGDASYNYTVADGCSIIGATTNNTIITGINPSLNGINIDDCSIGFYITNSSENDGEIGAVEGAFPSDSRFLVHPQYTATRGCYWDAGDDIPNNPPNGRRTFGVISPTAGDKNNKGMFIGTKFGATMILRRHNYTISSRTNANIGKPAPNSPFRLTGGYSTGNFLNLGGYFIGKNIGETTELQICINIWNQLQKIIDSNRDWSIPSISIPQPKLWFDAKDTSTIIRENGTNNVEIWNDKSGLNKNITDGRIGFTSLYVPSEEGIDFRSTRLQRSDGFYMGTIALVLTCDSVISSGVNSNKILAHDYEIVTTTFNGLGFGSKSTWMDDEVIWYIGSTQNQGRYYITSTSYSIPANQRFCLIMTRTGDRSGLINVNNTIQPVGYANSTSGNRTLDFTNNSSFRLGQDYDGTSPFAGYIHEFRNYSEPFTQAQVSALATELTTKWGIS